MQYFEGEKRQLCRTENFLPYHEGLKKLFLGKVSDAASDIFQSNAVLYKDKINFKLPGGNGFIAHQDAPAFVTFKQKYHLTVMIAVDYCTIENGCLEVAIGEHKNGILKQSEDGTIHPEVIQKLKWTPIPCKPGDIMFFGSYLPHLSKENRSDTPRRVFYLTYNSVSDGDYREAYYKHKRESFPPEIERIPGKDYSSGAALYNIGNPIRKI